MDPCVFNSHANRRYGASQRDKNDMAMSVERSGVWTLAALATLTAVPFAGAFSVTDAHDAPDPCLGSLRGLLDHAQHNGSHVASGSIAKLCAIVAPASNDKALSRIGNHSAPLSFIQQLEFQEEQAEWSVFPSTGTPPSPRGGHCSHLVLQTLYIFGGCAAGTRSKCLNDMHALDLSSGAWSRVATSGSAPHPASNVACASNGPVLAVFGGYAGTYTSKVHLFDATTRVWTLAMPAGVAPKPRQGATLTRFAGGFVLFGGTDDATPFNDVHVLASDAKQWTDPKARCVPMPCALPAPREGHSAALIGTKLWVYGGVGKVGRSYVSLTDLAYFDVTTSTWHDPAVQMQATDLAPSARSLHAALTLGSRLLILGGWITPQRTPLPDVAILDAETFSWSRPLPSGTPPPARYGQSLTLRGRTVFTFGGCAGSACTDEVRSLSFKYARRHTPITAEGAKSLGGAMAAAGPIIGSTSCPSSCSAHGKCWQGRCLCEPGYEGYDCSLLSECNCHERGVCAHGRCFCDPGFDGPQCELIARCANDCSAHGVCVHGRCTCAAGFTGADCSELVACPHGCSGRGICINAKCYCLYGSSGEGCEVTEPCPGSHEHTSCSGRGECFEGKCLCEPGFAGVACDEALPCPGDCRDADGVQRGRCVHGQCWCDPGFGGETCAEVASCVNDCSHRGVCFRGACACEAGYGGDDCSQALFECQANCTGHGACRLGTCFCEPSWQGVACEQPIECPHACSAHGLCLGGKCLCEEGYGGLDCAVPLPSCPNECHHHGVCVHGVCECDLEWAGTDCSVPRGCPGNDCSGHGVCAYGRCYCEPGFDGLDCATRTGCTGPEQCGSVGVCEHGRCFCDPGFYGPQCSHKIECPHGCGGAEQGVCASGRCFCYTGWGGDDCTRRLKCPSSSSGDTCSGNGRCERGQCVCEPGFTGEACEVQQTCPHECRNQGLCWGGRCLCFPGYEGEDCSGLACRCSPRRPPFPTGTRARTARWSRRARRTAPLTGSADMASASVTRASRGMHASCPRPARASAASAGSVCTAAASAMPATAAPTAWIRYGAQWPTAGLACRCSPRRPPPFPTGTVPSGQRTHLLGPWPMCAGYVRVRRGRGWRGVLRSVYRRRRDRVPIRRRALRRGQRGRRGVQPCRRG